MVLKHKVLDVAESIDSLRIFPRVMVLGYTAWSAHIIWELLNWYWHQPAAERSVQDAGLVTAVISAITGFGVPIFRIYTENGRDWNSQPARPVDGQQ